MEESQFDGNFVYDFAVQIPVGKCLFESISYSFVVRIEHFSLSFREYFFLQIVNELLV